MPIKTRIREIRRYKGLSCEYIAEKTGLSKSEINRIENGKRDPTLTHLYNISLALNVPFEEVYEITKEDPQE